MYSSEKYFNLNIVLQYWIGYFNNIPDGDMHILHVCDYMYKWEINNGET